MIEQTEGDRRFFFSSLNQIGDELNTGATL